MSQYTTAAVSVININSHVCLQYRAKLSTLCLQMQVNSYSNCNKSESCVVNRTNVTCKTDIVIVASRIQSRACISANLQPPTSETTACRLDSFVARCLAPASLSSLANSSKLVKVMAAAGTVLNMLVAQPL